MIKKLASFILCLALLLSFSVFAEQDGGADTVFSADFNDNELPAGSDVTFGDDGFIFAEDGKLRIEAAATYPPVSTVLFPFEVKLDEFIYECDVTVLSSLAESCWFSLCFGAVNDNILYQFTVKCGASDGDSVSLQYKNGASSWKKLSVSPLSEFIGENGISPDKFSDGRLKPGSVFRVAAAVKNGMAFGCIDGVTVVEGGLPAKRAGRIGLNARGVSVAVDNATISSAVPAWVSAADSFSAKLYTPDTGIIAPPAVIQRDRLTLPIYSEEKQRPDAVMITVRESGGELHGYDGAVDLGALEKRINALSGLVLPAFYVSDDKSASLLSEFIEESGCNDCFVIVSKAPLLEAFKDNKYIRTVVDMSSRDSVSGAETGRLLYSNGCRAVMLSEAAADRDTVSELHKRLITVWVSGTAGVDSLFDSAVNGADAVVTSESAALLTAFEKFDETTVIRTETVISDGGDGAAAPDNTLKGALSALDLGVSAVRLGVVCTKDGAAVLSRTGVTENLSSQLSIPDTTLAALKALTYTDRRMSATDGITTLEELFEAVYKEYPLSVFHLDVKDVQTLSGITDLIREYEMSDRCVILSADIPVLKAAAGLGMASAYTGGPYTADGRDPYVSLSSLCRTLNGCNSAYYAEPDNMPDELIRLMRSRGMFVCLSSAGDTVPLSSGCDAFTTGLPSRTSKLSVMLDASADKDGRLNAKVKYRDGTELDVTALCGIVTLSGDVRLSGGTVTGDGVFAVVCPQNADDGEKYSVCSKLIKIYRDAAETETDDNAENQDNRTLTVVIIAVSSAAGVAGVIMLLYLSGKKRKSEKNSRNSQNDS